jgi:hypothetical protein
MHIITTGKDHSMKQKRVDNYQEAVKAQRTHFPMMQAGNKKKTIKILLDREDLAGL